MNGAAAYINPKWATGIFLPDWLLEMDLTYGAMLCYGKLARLAQQRGFAFCRRDHIAKLLGVSTTQISAYVKELSKSGLLEVKRTGRGSHYRLPVHPNMTISKEEMDRRVLEEEWQRPADVKKTDFRSKETQSQTSRNPTSELKETSHSLIQRSDTENLTEKSRRSSITASSKFQTPEEANRLANLLRDLIAEKIPNSTAPTPNQLERWAADADMLNRIDGHSWAEIEGLIRWSRSDSFWQRNILSMGKLRERWNQLQANKNGALANARRAQSTEQIERTPVIKWAIN